MSRLIATSWVGRRWAAVIAAAGPHRRDGVDPMTLWPIRERRLLSGRLDGPIIYLAIGHQVAQYTGQTGMTMQERLMIHMRSEPKSRTWSHLACIVLDPDIPARMVDALEATAFDTMRPLMSKRKPRVRKVGYEGGGLTAGVRAGV